MPSSAAAAAPSREAASNLKDSLQPTITAALNLVSSAASGQASATTASSGSTSASSSASTSVSSASPVPAAVKKQRPLLPKETAQAVQRAVVWNPTKFQTSSQKWHMQKVQRQQQHGEQSAVQTQAQSQGQTRSPQQLQSQKQDSSSTRYQTRQAAKGNYTSLIIHLNFKLHITEYTKIERCLNSLFPPSSPAVQHKDPPQSTSSSTASVTSGSSSSFMSGDVQIPTVSADVAADIAKYTNKVRCHPHLLHSSVTWLIQLLLIWLPFWSGKVVKTVE